MTISQEVSKFVTGVKFSDFPSALVERAKQHILDTIGVTIAASGDPIAQIIRSYVADVGSSSFCNILGLDLKASISDSAMANGFLAHGLDYDDSSWRLIGHPSAAVLPAVLAVGQSIGCSGQDLITAYVIGTEVSCKLGLSAEPQLYESGWHATSVVGVLGATAGCGYLLGLDEEQLAFGLGVAASLAGGLRRNFGTMTKPFHAGAAAQHGVMASLLARHGIISNLASLEEQGGFFQNFTRGQVTGDFSSPGGPYDMLEPGFFVKPYPSCAATHTGIDAALYLVNEFCFSHEDVDRIEVGSGPVGPIMLFHNQPQSGFEGKFSMPFVVAMALIEEKVGLDSFTDQNVKDPRVTNLIGRTHFYVESDFSSRSIDEAPAIVTVHLKDGTVMRKKIEDPLGSPTNPMSERQLFEKYRDCTLRVLSHEKVERSLGLILELENVDTLGDLFNNLVP